MPGVRIQHATYRSTRLTLVDGNRAYRAPFDCPVCHRVHTHKTYHLGLDESGAVIVSPEIVARLKALPLMGGFRITNEVAKPPTQHIDLARPPVGAAITVHPTLVEPR